MTGRLISISINSYDKWKVAIQEDGGGGTDKGGEGPRSLFCHISTSDFEVPQVGNGTAINVHMHVCRVRDNKREK